MDIVTKAHIFCVSKHAFQTRKYSGEPYSNHPIRVAGMVMEAPHDNPSLLEDGYHIILSQGTLIAIALLHDILEDTPIGYDDFKSLFGATVANGVKNLTNTSKLDFPGMRRAERKAADREKIKATKYWIRLIKYCDRYDNLADTFEYVANWNIQKKFPPTQSEFIDLYIKESRELQEVLNEPELREIYGSKFFDRYNLNMLMDNLQNELELVSQGVKSA